jgi:hypothetical protein
VLINITITRVFIDSTTRVILQRHDERLGPEIHVKFHRAMTIIKDKLGH